MGAMPNDQSGPVVCIAGVVQGANAGTSTTDQGYRERIADSVRARYPGAIIFCPVAALHDSFAGTTEQVAIQFGALRAEPVLSEDAMPEIVLVLRERFRDLVRAAGSADLMVAYVPAELSMGTAMEMWTAYAAGRPVVTISPLDQNLAIVSTSTVLVRTLQEFEEIVRAGRLDPYFGG